MLYYFTYTHYIYSSSTSSTSRSLSLSLSGMKYFDASLPQPIPTKVQAILGLALPALTVP